MYKNTKIFWPKMYKNTKIFGRWVAEQELGAGAKRRRSEGGWRGWLLFCRGSEL